MLKMKYKGSALLFIAVLLLSQVTLLFTQQAAGSEIETEESVNLQIKDPMHMSDEEFFGAWDEAQQTWSVTPVLQYDLFEDLNEVRQLAQKGDYQKAKEALLVYYRNRTSVPEYKLETADYSLYTDMITEKIFGWLQVDAVVGVTQVQPQWQYHTVDLAVGDTVPSGLFLLDSDMDGNAVEIYSRRYADGKYGAYLEVTTDGETTIYPAVADTYISAGENQSRNFGSEEILYAREEAGDSRTPFGTNTARPYFRFDTDQITGRVTEIKFHFYARSNGPTDKKVFVFTTGNEKKFDESKFVWEKHYPQIFNYKQTGYVWDSAVTGEWNLDAEWINYGSRMYQMGWLIPQYRLTGEERYAREGLEILMSMYTQQNRAFFPRDLEAGWRTEYLCILFFGTLNSESITPDLLTAQLKYMYLHLSSLKDVSTIGAFNQVSAKLCGFLRLAAYIPELAPVEWWEMVKDKMNELYDNYLNEDGSYTEATSGYISGVVVELRTAVALIALRDGEEDPKYHNLLEHYRKLTKYLFDMAMPYGKTTPYGDGGRTDSKNFCYNEYKQFPAVDPNGYFTYFATEGLYGNKPNYNSIVYSDKAIAFLKSGWLPEDFGATIGATFGGTHSHADDLSLDVYAYGAPLLIDAGGSSYSQGSLMSGVGNKTYSHNTIEIDLKNQAGYDYGNINTNQPQKLLLATNQLFDFVEAGSQNIYPGFDVNRKVLFLHNSYWIVSDYITPEDNEPHIYKQAWRPDTRNHLTLDSETKAMTTHYDSGPNIQVVPADAEQISARVEQSYMNNPNDGEQLTDYVRYCREGVSGPQTFDTVLYPDREGEKTYVAVKRLDLDQVPTIDATALQIDIGLNTGFYYSSNEAAPPTRSFGKYTTNAQMAYIEEDRKNEISMLAMTKASSLKQGEIAIVSSDEPMEDFGAKWSGQTLQLFTQSGTLPRSGVRIYSQRPINEVTLNGTQVQFTVADHFVTTDGTPLSGALN